MCRAPVVSFTLFGMVFFTAAGIALTRFASRGLDLVGIDAPALLWIPLLAAALSAGPIAALLFGRAARAAVSPGWKGACVGLYAVLVGVAVYAALLGVLRPSAGAWLLIGWGIAFVAACVFVALPAMVLGAVVGVWSAGGAAVRGTAAEGPARTGGSPDAHNVEQVSQ